jgi:two-component system OmpR family sensor kinase
MRWSIRIRLTLWYCVAMAVVLTLFSGSVLWLHARWARADFDSELTSIGAALSRVMREELRETANLEKGGAEAGLSTDVPGRATAILDQRGTVLAAHLRGFPYAASMLPRGMSAGPHLQTLHAGSQTWRVMMRLDPSPFGNYVVLVGGTLEELDRQQTLLARVLFVAMPLVVVLTAGLSWWVASGALRPVTIMAAEAEAITARSSAWRLNAPTTTDELGQLARAFNRLLNRLETSSRRQREFMADASHELRTPVSVIQTAAEVTLQQPVRESWEYREALTIVRDQGGRLKRMVEDMLVLARADAGGSRLTTQLLYVDDIVAECVRAASVVATVRNIQIVTALQPDLAISADEELLRRLVMNLLDNAVQYAPAGGSVTVTVRRDAGVVTMTVSDTGPGIPPADRERVFERSVRLDPARSTSSGTGLGLPIARWIAEQHDGTLTLDENDGGGCVFVVRLPMKDLASTGEQAPINRETARVTERT